MKFPHSSKLKLPSEFEPAENDEKHLLKWIKWFSNKTRQKSLRYLERIIMVLQAFIEDNFLEQADIVKKTGISKSAVSRIVKELEEIGALQRISLPIARLDKSKKFRYVVNSKFVEFLNKYIINVKHSNNSKIYDPKNLRLVHESRLLINEMTQEELEKWVRDGWFRIHGFQRKWILKNYKLIDDEDKWLQLAALLNEKLPPQPIRKVKIGRNRRGIMYIVKAYSERFKVHFLLHFRSNSLIITLPKDESIYISWDEFNEEIESEIVREINQIVSKAVNAYSDIFKQHVLAYDCGWVGKRKQLKPEVAYIDPDGIIRKVYEVEGAIYIEGLGFWIDHSLKPAPEVEFESVEEASKFKKAIETLASGDLNESLESVKCEIEDVKKKIEEVNSIREKIELLGEKIDKMYSNIVKIISEDVVPIAIEKAMATVTEKFIEFFFRDNEEIREELRKLLLQKLKIEF